MFRAIQWALSGDVPKEAFAALKERQLLGILVPESEGGWTIRELGVFDAAGSLFVVGNLPEVYKPLPEEGSFGDAVLRLAFVVTNAAVVSVMAAKPLKCSTDLYQQGVWCIIGTKTTMSIVLPT